MNERGTEMREADGIESDLIPWLQKMQEENGYVSPQAVAEISRRLKISESEIFGVASFYAQFRFTVPGRHGIKVCLGTACHVRGAQILSEAVTRELGIVAGQTTPDGRFDLQRVACLGCCALAPVVQVNEETHSRVSVTRLAEILKKYE